jgi:hypothetical protein
MPYYASPRDRLAVSAVKHYSHYDPVTIYMLKGFGAVLWAIMTILLTDVSPIVAGISWGLDLATVGVWVVQAWRRRKALGRSSVIFVESRINYLWEQKVEEQVGNALGDKSKLSWQHHYELLSFLGEMSRQWQRFSTYDDHEKILKLCAVRMDEELRPMVAEASALREQLLSRYERRALEGGIEGSAG